MGTREPNKKYSAEFKQEVVETMLREKLSYAETAAKFRLRHKRVQDWERIYLTYGATDSVWNVEATKAKGVHPR